MVMVKYSRDYTVGRFGIEVAYYPFEQGNLYRAFGPYGMLGNWHEDEHDCQDDLLEMMKQVRLSDEENEVALAIYEIVHNL